MDSEIHHRVARVVADLRELANLLTADNPADAIRLQGCAAMVRELEDELVAAEFRKVTLVGSAIMFSIELTDDEIGMLNWLREFPGKRVDLDSAVERLLANGLARNNDGRVEITPAGVEWLDRQKR